MRANSVAIAVVAIFALFFFGLLMPLGFAIGFLIWGVAIGIAIWEGLWLTLARSPAGEATVEERRPASEVSAQPFARGEMSDDYYDEHREELPRAA
jgi:uncharacterized membrane protein